MMSGTDIESTDSLSAAGKLGYMLRVHIKPRKKNSQIWSSSLKHCELSIHERAMSLINNLLLSDDLHPLQQRRRLRIIKLFYQNSEAA